MTQVDFYIEETPRPGGHRKLACRLAEKAYRLGNTVFIHTDSHQTAVDLDELLWTFDEASFVPHCRVAQVEAEPPPVLIGHGEPPVGAAAEADVLINLTRDVPDFFSAFQRVAEMVGNAEAEKAAGRERFRFYRDRGYPLEDHRL